MQVVAMDNEVVFNACRVQRKRMVGEERAVGHGEMMRVDVLFAFEF